MTAVHLKGDVNLVADFLSRERVLESEWSLNSEVFQMLIGKWGAPPDRPVDIPGQCKGGGLFLPQQARSSGRTGRSSAKVDLPLVLCLSPFSVDTIGTQTVKGGYKLVSTLLNSRKRVTRAIYIKTWNFLVYD